MHFSESDAIRRRRLKSIAKQSIQGRLWSSFGACMIPVAINFAAGLIPADLYVLPIQGTDGWVSLSGIVISLLVALFVLGPLSVGVAGFFLERLKNPSHPVSMLSVCDCFGAGYWRLVLGMSISQALMIFPTIITTAAMLFGGWAFSMNAFSVSTSTSTPDVIFSLLVLGSLVLMLFLSIKLLFVPFLLIDAKEMTAREAIRESFRLSRGRVVELIVLSLSFALWALLTALPSVSSLFPFGLLGYLAAIYYYPYLNATRAAYYVEFSSISTPVPEEVAAHE